MGGASVGSVVGAGGLLASARLPGVGVCEGGWGWVDQRPPVATGAPAPPPLPLLMLMPSLSVFIPGEMAGGSALLSCLMTARPLWILLPPTPAAVFTAPGSSLLPLFPLPPSCWPQTLPLSSSSSSSSSSSASLSLPGSEDGAGLSSRGRNSCTRLRAPRGAPSGEGVCRRALFLLSVDWLEGGWV